MAPLAGIFSVLSQQKVVYGSSILVMPVDMPLVSALSLQRLLAFSQQTEQSCFFQSTWLPVCNYMNDTVKQQVRQFPDNYDRCSVRQFLLKIAASPLQPEDETQLTNCNSPEQWDAVLTRRTFAKTIVTIQVDPD